MLEKGVQEAGRTPRQVFSARSSACHDVAVRALSPEGHNSEPQ